MVVAERYPNLKANQGFRDLRVQLEGTENRITVARNRYIQTVQDYNVLTRSFPTNLTAMVFGYRPKANFTAQNEAQISAPPMVSFGKPASKCSYWPCVMLRWLTALLRVAGDRRRQRWRRTCSRCRRSPPA